MPQYQGNRAYPVGLAPLDPNETLDYIVDWTDWLAASSDTISSASIIAPTGITAASTLVINANTAVQTWLSVSDSSLEGSIVTIVCRIVTSGGRTADRSFMIKIKSK